MLPPHLSNAVQVFHPAKPECAALCVLPWAAARGVNVYKYLAALGYSWELNGHFGSCNLLPTVNLLPKESQVDRTHGALSDSKLTSKVVISCTVLVPRLSERWLCKYFSDKLMDLFFWDYKHVSIEERSCFKQVCSECKSLISFIASALC